MPPARAPPHEDPRTQRDVVFAVRYHRCERRDETRRVLVIRMDHHDDVRAEMQRRAIAGLLIAAVADVPLVGHDERSEPSGERDGLVGAGIVDHHDGIDDVLGQFLRTVRRNVRTAL